MEDALQAEDMRRGANFDARLYKIERRLNSTGVHSENFWTRSFTILFHSVVAQVVIWSSIWLLAVLFVGIIAILEA